jgi:hypothetical protein
MQLLCSPENAYQKSGPGRGPRTPGEMALSCLRDSSLRPITGSLAPVGLGSKGPVGVAET